MLAVIVSSNAGSQSLTPINLGTSADFTILAGTMISNIPTSTISGDVGLIPANGSGITGLSSQEVIGTIFTSDNSGPDGSMMESSILNTAKNDLTAAYNDAEGRTPVPTDAFLNPGSGNIGGLNLVPGLYKFTGDAWITGSDVTLAGSASDVWIFQIASSLTVGDNIHVVLTGGALADNIFWQVGTSVTLGANSIFNGTIMADQSITVNSGATIEGRLLSNNSSVALTSSTASKPPKGYSNPAAIYLLTASNYRVLAGSTVTIGSGTTVTGDVGVSPGTEVVNSGTVTGTIYSNDANAGQAKIDLSAAYIDVAGRTYNSRIPKELSGTTLKRGIYVSSPGTFELTGNLTLSGSSSDIFIFKMASTLTTGTNSNLTLVGGALASNIFWQVGSSASIAGDFKGNILALTSITGNTTGSIDGRTLARNGAVTVNSTTVLPVELVSFTAKEHQKNIVMQWSTASEANNYGFEVHRSVMSVQDSDKHWTKAGFVKGNGTTNIPKEYTFTQYNLTPGKYLYRLKQIDRDGKFTYSRSVEVSLGQSPKEFTLLQNYPNPFNPATTIEYSLAADSQVSLKVYNLVGDEIATLVNTHQEAGTYIVPFSSTIQTLDLSSGVFFYRLEAHQTADKTADKKDGGLPGIFVSTKKLILMK